MGKKRRDGRAAKRGNNNCASSNAEARNSDGGGLQQSTTTAIRYGNGTYEREMRDGRPRGKGKLALYTGDVYEGEYVDGHPHGKGRVKWADGEVYDGEWKDGIRNGRGVNRYANGDVYDGEFVDGKPHGRGDYKWADGRVYEGEFKEGGRHGKGTEKFPTGEIYEGIWMKGEFVRRKLRSQRSQQRRLERGDAARQMCEYCGADDYHYKLQVCSGCNLALYCSDACQKAARGSHRRICGIVPMLPSRESDRLVLRFDRDSMVDLDAGLRYATKHMSNLKHLAIDLKEMANGDALKLSTKQLSSLLRSKEEALESVFLVSGHRHDSAHGIVEAAVWRELRGLKQLRLERMEFHDTESVRDIIRQQKDTLAVLDLPMLQIDCSKAKARKSIAMDVSVCKQLVKLDLTGFLLMDSDLKVVLNGLPHLRVLNLTRHVGESHEFTDNTCGLIARKCPGLQFLCLYYHDTITVKGIRKIFEGCPHLRSFNTSTRKLSWKDVRSLLEIAPQLLHFYFGDKTSIIDLQILSRMIEDTGGRTIIQLRDGGFFRPDSSISTKTRDKYESQIDLLENNVWSRRSDPEVANEWAEMFEG